MTKAMEPLKITLQVEKILTLFAGKVVSLANGETMTPGYTAKALNLIRETAEELVSIKEK